MTQTSLASRASRGGRMSWGQILVAAASLLALAGCVGGGASPSPTVEPTAVIASPLVATPVAGGSSAPSATPAATPARTTTDWGEIWDALPPAFPVPPDAQPADLAEGPFSGTYTTATASAAVADAMATALRGGGYSAVTVTGPMEGGTVTIEATGAGAGCRVRATVRPLGGLTAIEVLYGSACPFE
ncbi:MAG: hypothetical protein WCH74_08080 [Chloroflexota bacterium]